VAKSHIESSDKNIIGSFKYAVSQELIVERLDSILRLTTQVVKGLNDAIKVDEDPVL
jgi:hypothetical protein